MFQNENFFAIHDLSSQGLFLWASPSITLCLGYDPEEVVGLSIYPWIHPDDIASCQVAHQEIVLNEIVGTQMFLRLKRKDGSYSPCVVLGCICYQYIVSCYTLMNDSDIRKGINHVPVHSSTMSSLVGSKEKEFERISRNHKAFYANTWNPNSLDLELRACLLLNRFTRNLCIMYASPSCELIFGVDPDDLLGKPLLLYIRADDLASFVEQGDLVKSTAAVVHMRFWFQSPNRRQEIPIEATLLGASDALIVILRKCLPFKRKQFITDHSYSDCYATSSHSRASYNNGFNRSFSASSWDDRSSRDSSFGGNSSYGRYGNSHSSRDDSMDCLAKLANSPASSLSSSVSSFQSTSSQGSCVTHAYQTPLRSVPLRSINSIRELDRDRNRLRPLTSLHEDRIDSANPYTTPIETYPRRAFHSADLDVDEPELTGRISRINLCK